MAAKNTQVAPIGSRWKAPGDSRVFVVIERKPFGNLVLKQEDRAYIGDTRQSDLIRTHERLD